MTKQMTSATNEDDKIKSNTNYQDFCNDKDAGVNVEERLKQLDEIMMRPDFWQDKNMAQEVLKEINFLKEKQRAVNKYDKGDAVLSLFSGAGGDDAEDWCKILFEMYSKFIEKKGWEINIIHKHEADHGGLKNITFEVLGKEVYGTIKNEAGVHRLVRISPFSAKKLRHTSFALLEVIPKLVDPQEVEIPDRDIRLEFSRSSGAGGQNVNKRDTAVRVVHLPTKIAVHVSAERSQQQNRERAMELLKSRLYRKAQDEQRAFKESMGASDVENEWGHQIRSYVFHPYQMVKDHRTGIETSDVKGVLDGELDEFIEGEKNL